MYIDLLHPLQLYMKKESVKYHVTVTFNIVGICIIQYNLLLVYERRLKTKPA